MEARVQRTRSKMAIPTNELRLRVRDTILTVRQNAIYEQSGYDVVHQPTSAVVGAGAGQVLIPNYQALETYDATIYHAFLSEFGTWQAWHQARSVLADYSLQDAAWTLEKWAFTPEDGTWTITHPLSGEWAGKTIDTDTNGRPTLLGRLTTIFQEVLPPSTWTFAESPAAEQLRVWCTSVSGADHYNVYNDLAGQFFLLGQAPTNTPTIISVPAGTYNVRIAPVDSGGIVGILANTTYVNVAISGAVMSAMPRNAMPLSPPTEDTPLPSPENVTPFQLSKEVTSFHSPAIQIGKRRIRLMSDRLWLFVNRVVNGKVKEASGL